VTLLSSEDGAFIYYDRAEVQMALSDSEYGRLKQKCNTLEDGPNYRCNDYIRNLINTVIDFQMMKEAAVQKATEYIFRKHGKITSHNQLKELLDSFPNTYEGNLAIARELWDYDFWSRAEFLRKIIEGFEKRGIRDHESLKKWVHNADYHRDVEGRFRTQYHSIGPAIFKWLELRLGVDTVKPDVRVLRFVEDIIGRSVSPDEAVSALTRIAKETKRDAFRLDAAIWNLQRGNMMKTSSTDRVALPESKAAIRQELEPVSIKQSADLIPALKPPSSRPGEKSKRYYDLIERSRINQRPNTSTELMEFMMIQGVTMEQALNEVNRMLTKRTYNKSNFMGFIEHRRRMGYKIIEDKGVWIMLDIRL